MDQDGNPAVQEEEHERESGHADQIPRPALLVLLARLDGHGLVWSGVLGGEERGITAQDVSLLQRYVAMGLPRHQAATTEVVRVVRIGRLYRAARRHGHVLHPTLFAPERGRSAILAPVHEDRPIGRSRRGEDRCHLLEVC